MTADPCARVLPSPSAPREPKSSTSRSPCHRHARPASRFSFRSLVTMPALARCQPGGDLKVRQRPFSCMAPRRSRPAGVPARTRAPGTPSRLHFPNRCSATFGFELALPPFFALEARHHVGTVVSSRRTPSRSRFFITRARRDTRPIPPLRQRVDAIPIESTVPCESSGIFASRGRRLPTRCAIGPARPPHRRVVPPAVASSVLAWARASARFTAGAGVVGAIR